MATITSIEPENYDELSIMVGELLDEIIQITNDNVFQFDQEKTLEWLKTLIKAEKYWVFIAMDNNNDVVGFISLYESYALNTEGAYGTIPELYVRPAYRSQNIGKDLLDHAIKFSYKKNWKRLEITTPPLPEFARTLQFYRENNFQITGGRKLKLKIQ
jgi:GNAT superfamily N-acetyltransferase